MILVDTTPLVALCDPREASHRAAVAQLESFAARSFVVCDPVLTEACFHLPHRSQRQRLGALLDALPVTIVPMTQEDDLRRDVLAWLVKYADHDPDYADACLAVLSGRDKRWKVWTYDPEFRTTWRRPDGTMIPLAVPAKR